MIPLAIIYLFPISQCKHHKVDSNFNKKDFVLTGKVKLTSAYRKFRLFFEF